MDKPLDNNADRLNALVEVQGYLNEAHFDLYAFMELVVEQMQKLTPATGVIIELVEGDNMIYRAATGSAKPHLGLSLPRENSISGLCVTSHQILRCDETEKDERVNLPACRKVGARSMVVAPLFHNGDAIGVLKILSDKPHAFSEDDVKTLQLMAGYIASGLAKQMLQEFRDFI